MNKRGVMEEAAEKSGELVGKGVRKSFIVIKEVSDDLKKQKTERTAERVGKMFSKGVKKSLQFADEFEKGFRRGFKNIKD